METIKRGPGRPQKLPGEHTGYIRGAKEKTIKRFKRACENLNLDTGEELNNVMNKRCDELENVKVKEAILIKQEIALRSQLEEVQQKRQQIARQKPKNNP